MANELPPVSGCEETVEADPTDKCYTIKEAIPVCATTNPASSLQSSDCTRLDNTYDMALQAAVIPTVGSQMQINVCNASIYTVGSWIEFVDGYGVGSIFQIVAINTINQYITVRNSCEDGITAIDGNASPGASIQAGSRFIVRGKTSCKTTEDQVADLEALFPSLEEICLDSLSAREVTEEIKILGALTSSDCDGGAGSPQPCLRFGLTKELRDGSLRLGNLDATTATDPSLTPLFADVNGTIVSGETTESVYKWLLTDEENIVVFTNSNQPASLSSNDYQYTLSNPPSAATHAIIRVHLHIDDNPAGNIAVSFGNISPVQSKSSWGESYTSTEVCVPIVDGKVNYKVHASDGGSMNFAGANTELRIEVVGYEKITTL